MARQWLIRHDDSIPIHLGLGKKYGQVESTVGYGVELVCSRFEDQIATYCREIEVESKARVAKCAALSVNPGSNECSRTITGAPRNTGDWLTVIKLLHDSGHVRSQRPRFELKVPGNIYKFHSLQRLDICGSASRQGDISDFRPEVREECSLEQWIDSEHGQDHYLCQGHLVHVPSRCARRHDAGSMIPLSVKSRECGSGQG